MKTRKITHFAFIALTFTSFFFTSCSSDSDVDYNQESTKELTLELNSFLLDLPVEGGMVWENTLKPSDNPQEKVFFSTDNFSLSHYVTVWETSVFWRGFTISNSTDKKNHQNDFYKNNMYGTMGSAQERFLVVNSQEYPTDITLGTNIDLDQTYAYIELHSQTQGKLQPVSMQISNSPYSYYAITQGDQFTEKFTKGDYFKVLVHGLDKDKNIVNAEPVELYLANWESQELEIVTEWKKMDLSEIPNAKYLVFYLESSDKGQFGMNTPAYFTMKDLKILETKI